MGIEKNSKAIVTQGLVLYLDAANPRSYPGSGSTWKDLSGNGYHGTLVNSPVYSTENEGHFLFVNPSYQYVTTPLSSAGSASGSFTVSAWAKWNGSEGTTGQGTSQILTRGRDTNGNGWSASLSISNGPSASVVTTSGGDMAYGTTSNLGWMAGEWHYVTSVWRAGVSISVYGDGIFRASTNTSTTTLRSSTLGWVVGSISGNAPGHYFNGNVGLVHVYNRVLTAAEILQNYQATKGRYI